VCFSGGVPVPEVVLQLRGEEREPRVARTIGGYTRIDADAEQLFSDVGEFRCAIFSARADRDPAVGRANDEARRQICGAGGDIDSRVRFPDQAAVYGVVLKRRIIHRAREVQTLIVARVRRQLETCRASFASVAGKDLERAFCEQDVVLTDQSRRSRHLDAADVIDVGLYGNSVSVGTGEVAVRAVVAVISDDLKVVQELLARRQSITFRLGTSRQYKETRDGQNCQELLHGFCPCGRNEFLPERMSYSNV